jgi:hypothetical protein
MLRVLCVDHFFEQDIAALEYAAGDNTRCWTIPYEHWFKKARRVFPDEVFTGITEYFEPKHELARARYAAEVERDLRRLLIRYRFDALVAPSDTFFWLRGVINACKALGVPTVVLQKEATIPPGWLEGPAREWNAASPFIADQMLVSSDHHKRFWVNGGVDPDIITVTGQPRFDIYCDNTRQPAWPQLGYDLRPGPTVLFLTYDDNAYLPVIDRSGLHPWREMRAQTEERLLALAEAGRASVLIKAHPQPAEDQSARLEDMARRPGVTVLDPRHDVRHFISAADLVVGFQSTALFEALAAGKPTVYTWWTPATARYAGDLIPFHEAADALHVVRSPADLSITLDRLLNGGLVQENPAASEALVRTYLGTVDGRAAARCWAELERIVTQAARPPEQTALRARSQRRRPLQVAYAGAMSALWAAARPGGRIAYPLYRATRGDRALSKTAVDQALSQRARLARQRFAATRT